VAELPQLDADLRRKVLEEWNATERPLPPVCVHELVEAAARAHPGRVAVAFEGASLTYAALNHRANRLARRLRRRGVGPETRVGVCIERSLELPVALLGVLKAGGAYVPLDPAYPRERLEHMVEDGGVRLVIAQPHLAGRVAVQGVEVVRLDTAEGEAERESGDDVYGGALPANLAYVLFTSGSTGRPKGVMVSHQAVVRLLAQEGWCRFEADEVFLQFVPIAFDVSTFELWGPLSCGARLVLFLPHTPSLDELAGFIRREGVTTLWLTSGLFHQMVDSRPTAFAGVRRLLSGGDVLSPPHVRRVLELNPGLVMVNGYGPTEVTTYTTCHVMRDAAEATDPVSIGRPIGNTRVYVLDAAMEPVAPGVPGELYAGGHGVARGYQGRPALTAGRFVPDPFAARPGARLYRTGDRARWRADGTLEFMGRIDQQVKIRGFRIEPGEVESALRGHPAVCEAAVVAREDAPGDRRLVAYVVASGEPAQAGELAAHLRTRLPDYMVPSAFVALDALPLTANGKVDRRALPAPAAVAEAGRAAYVAPRDPTEELLAAAWADVLGVERVGVHDDVFALGGHSLASMRVAARLRDATGVELPLAALFENPTVESLARAAGEAAGGTPDFPPVTPAPREGRIPPALQQESVCFLQQLAPGNLSYHFQAALTLRGPLRADLLERALTEIVRRHEILRTAFPSDESGPYQRIEAPWEVRLPVVDLTHLAPGERPAAVEAWIAAHVREPFDLARLPLIQWTLLRTAPDRHVLVEKEHHVVHDGWSINALLGELVRLYGAFLAGEPSPLAELPVQFADYAVWQREWMRSPAARAQLDYWKGTLAGFPGVLELPTDRPRPPTQRFLGAAPRFRLPGELYRALKGVARREGATLFMTMLAAFDVLLARYAGTDDVAIASALAARRQREVEGLIGMFVNAVPIRTDLSGDPTFSALLARVRRTTLGAYANQDIPFEAVVEAVAPERDLSRNPLVQVGFSFHDSAVPELALPGVELELEVGLSNGSAKFDMQLIVIPHGEQRLGRAGTDDSITVIWEYDSDLFDAATVERMFAHYRALLEHAAARPGARISSLPMAAPGEDPAAARANQTARPYPREPVHRLFEAAVAASPGAVAIEFGHERVTYAELDARAERLARRLRALGVGPDARVAVCLDRSPSLVAALFGVLKAGGAWVPLDPAYPAERIAYVLADARPAVVVTDAALAGRLPAPGVPIVLADAEGDETGATAGGVPEVSPDDLAYLIYTSGSTGTPKGVMVPHGAVANFLASMRHAPGLVPGDRLLAVTTAGFDISVLELFLPLTTGATVVLADRETAADAARLAALLQASGAGVMQATPATWRMLLESGWRPGPGLTLLSGGEALPPELAEKLAAGGAALWNLYGPTETTVWSAAERVDPARGVALGRPIANTRVQVVDAALRPVPVGVPGELAIAGDGVARGYRGRPGATAERFVPDPLSPRPGARMYRTGDRARWRADGRLEFMGRLDAQVKVRGHRIEPAEVEAALLRHPAVRQAVVGARGGAGAARLVAWLLPASEPVPPGELRAAAREILPEFMVPTSFVWMDAFPLTPSGKLDRRALPEPGGARPEVAEFVAPRTPVEEALAAIWREVLGVDRVGVHDRFFDLGGHSLLATQVISRIQRSLGAELPLRALFEAPTVAALAGRVARAAPPAGGDAERIRPLARRSRAGVAGD
jgi:amino acid adenylation domain-containing protein